MPDQPYDKLWKGLPSNVLVALLRLALPSIGPELIPFQTELVPPVALRLDGVFLGEVESIRCLLHIEYQNSLDPTMPRRMYEYDVDLERAAFSALGERLPVLPIVIWAVPGKTPAPVYQVELLGMTLAHHTYFEIHLPLISWQQDLDPVLLVLAPYFQGVQREDLVDIGERLYAEADPEQGKVLLASFLALSQQTFGTIQDVLATLLERLGLLMMDIEQAIVESPLFQSIVARKSAESRAEGEAKGRAEGEAKGKAEGIAEGAAMGKAEGEAKGIVAGMAKGKAEGLAEAVATLWQTMYQSALPADIAAVLPTYSEQQLLAILSAIGARPSEAELRATFHW